MTLLYATAAIICIMLSEIDRKQLLTATFVQRSTGKRIPASFRVIFQVRAAARCSMPVVHTTQGCAWLT